MKILFVTPLYPPEIGGPATYAKLLMGALPEQGHQVTLIKFSDVKRFPSGIRHGVLFLKILWKSFSHDIIFAQDMFSVGLPSALVALVTRKKFLVRVPGDYAWEQGCARLGVTDSIDVFQTKKYGWKIELYRTIQKFIVRTADQVIAPSRYFADVVNRWVLPKNAPVIAMYNGIEINEITPFQKKDYAVGDVKKIISAGRMVPWKEFKSLITLLTRHSSWTLTLIGDGPEKNTLQTYAQKVGVSERVFFKGSMQQTTLWETVAASDVFVLNSSFESFSYQAVEVMALGVPLITTDACNMQEIVKDQESGIIIPAKNDELLERNLVYVLGNDQLRKKIGQGGITQSQMFSKEKIIETIIKVLEKITTTL